jgi:hypothetical protein
MVSHQKNGAGSRLRKPAPIATAIIIAIAINFAGIFVAAASRILAGGEPSMSAIKIETMAQELARRNAHGDERTAIRTLSGTGVGQGDIVLFIDKARARAAEIVAARAVAAPTPSTASPNVPAAGRAG